MISFTVAAGGCNGRDAPGAAPAGTDATVESWRLADVPVLEVGVDPELPLHRVGAVVLLPDGGIAIAHQASEVLVLDPEGQLLARLGGRGDGPGEFQQLSGLFLLGPDSLAAVNAFPPRVAVFGPDAALVREFGFEVQPQSPAPTSDGGWVGGVSGPLAFTATEPALVEAQYRLLRFSATGEVLDTITVLPGRRAFGTAQSFVSVPYAPAPHFASAGARLFVGWSGSDTIQVRSEAGDLLDAFRDAAAPHPLTPELIERHNQEREQRLREQAQRSGVVAREAAGATLVAPFPDHAPHYERLLAAAPDELWVQRSLLPGDGERVWRIHRGGRLAAVLETPANFVIRAVADDQVAGVWTDALGVETVRVYPLRR
jgi:hypothetical protein